MKLRRRHATMEPNNWAIQYKKPVMRVMLPPMANPKVTAGFKWPPEMLAATETPTNSANAWATATATSPVGSKAASFVSSSIEKQHHNQPLHYSMYVCANILQVFFF